MPNLRHKAPPIEEPAPRHKRKSGRKTFKIEYRYTSGNWPWSGKWQPWSGYSTEKQRYELLKRKATSNCEYRKQ